MSYISTKFLVVYYFKLIIYLIRFTSKYFLEHSVLLNVITMSSRCKRRCSTQVCIRIFIVLVICEKSFELNNQKYKYLGSILQHSHSQSVRMKVRILSKTDVFLLTFHNDN